MKRAGLICLIHCFAAAPFLLSQVYSRQPMSPSAPALSPISAPLSDPHAQARILNQYGKLPLSFEANQGQADERVKFLSRTGDYELFLTADEAVMTLRGKKRSPSESEVPLGSRRDDAAIGSTATLRMKLRHADPAAKVTGVDQLSGAINYFIGNDPSKWRTNVPAYAKVKYEGIYSGIDLLYYGNQRQLEYDFIVAPEADPRTIAFEVSGVKRIRQNANGDLVFKMEDNEIRWQKPLVYQEKDGTRQKIAARYAITSTNRVAFDVAKYDASRPLYIDPVIYATYLGGSQDDYGYGIAVDSAGNAYVTGVAGAGFPVTTGVFKTACCGAFVTKFNPTGSALVYSTYLAGSGNNAGGSAIVVDSTGDAYIAGLAGAGFPVTAGAFQTHYHGGGNDVFVTELNPSGSALIYSTYLGGSGEDSASGIALDSAGNAYVTGATASTDFPTTAGSFQTSCAGSSCGDAFVAKLNSTGSTLVYSTYLGGSQYEYSAAIAADNGGNAYVTGYTASPDFPTRNPLQATYSGGWDVFVTKFDPTGSSLVYSTYLGGPKNDFGYGIAADGEGNAYVTGSISTTTCNRWGCFFYAFVDKIDAAGSSLSRSYYSNENYSTGHGIALDASGNAYVIGTIWQYPYSGSYSCTRAFVVKVNPSVGQVGSPTYLRGTNGACGYGIAADDSGNAYVTGTTPSTNFPTKNPVQSANAGGLDAFVAKIELGFATTTTLSSSLNPSTYGQPVVFTAVLKSTAGTPPDGETVSFIKAKQVLGTGALVAGSASFTTSTLKVGTNSITAVYAGDSNFVGSKSNIVKQVVNRSTP